MPALSSLCTEVQPTVPTEEPGVRYMPRSLFSPPFVEDASANRMSLGTIQDAKGKKYMVCVAVAGSRRKDCSSALGAGGIGAWDGVCPGFSLRNARQDQG